MGRGQADDEATRVDASVLRKQDDAPPESFDEPTALMRRGRGQALAAEVTIRTRPTRASSDDAGSLPRETVAGRLDRGDEAPPLPFEAKVDSAPPPPAVDLYEGGELDPLNVTGKLKSVGGAALPFEGQRDGATPPAVVLGTGGPSMGETSTMLQRVPEAALPFDAPQPKYPPRQLVPLEQNPLYAGGLVEVGHGERSASRSSTKFVVAALVLVVAVVATVLLVRGA